MTTDESLEGVTPAIVRGLSYLYPRRGRYEQWEVDNIREVLRAALVDGREALADFMHMQECPYEYVCQCDMDTYRAYVSDVIYLILGSDK